jgi:glycosyltransferase involved in cell wall biosynthesis
VYIDHIARLSGGELALARLIAAMPEISAHVVLGEDGPLQEMLQKAGATVEVLPLNPNVRDVRRDRVGTGADAVRSAVRTLGYTLRLACRLRQLSPDVVHTNSLKAGYYGCLAARLAGRPVIWHVRDRIAEDYLPARVVRLTRLALKYLPDYVVSNSEETFLTCHMNRHGRAADNLLPARARGWGVIGGVISDPCSGSDSPAVRGEGIVITMVGRLAPWKGQDVFIRAFESAFGDSPGVQGRIIGSAMFGEEDYAESLLSLVDDLHLDDRIHLCGFTDQVAHELSRSDVLVHASTVPEPFGQVIVEGMAAGLPVVASAAGGPAEIITDGVDGLLTLPGNVDDLASAMRRLAENPELRSQLGRAARIRAQDFGPEVISEKWNACYREVVAGSRR